MNMNQRLWYEGENRKHEIAVCDESCSNCRYGYLKNKRYECDEDRIPFRLRERRHNWCWIWSAK